MQHTDVTRSLLGAEATPAEAAALDAIQYTSNDVWLHTDQSLMPSRRAAWASWNCVVKEGGKGEGSDLVCCSYWVNLLQNLPPGAHIARRASGAAHGPTLLPPSHPPTSFPRRRRPRRLRHSQPSDAAEARHRPQALLPLAPALHPRGSGRPGDAGRRRSAGRRGHLVRGGVVRLRLSRGRHRVGGEGREWALRRAVGDAVVAGVVRAEDDDPPEDLLFDVRPLRCAARNSAPFGRNSAQFSRNSRAILRRATHRLQAAACSSPARRSACCSRRARSSSSETRRRAGATRASSA